MDRNNAGTPLFMAPEHFRGETCKASDIWSLGVTLHHLVTDDYPFLGATIDATRNLVEKFDPDFPEDKKISSECKDLILKMLDKDPKKRISIGEILEHPWIKNNKFDSKSHSHDV